MGYPNIAEVLFGVEFGPANEFVGSLIPEYEGYVFDITIDNVASSTIDIYKGDTKDIICNIRRNGDAFDLSDYTIELNVKGSYEDEDSDILFTILGTVAIPSLGVAVFSITSSHSNIDVDKKYYFDIKMYNTNKTIVKTLKTGIISILSCVRIVT